MSQALQRTWPEVHALPGLRGQRTALEKKENYKESRKRRLFFGRGDLTEDEGGGGRRAGGTENGERAEAPCCVSRGPRGGRGAGGRARAVPPVEVDATQWYPTGGRDSVAAWKINNKSQRNALANSLRSCNVNFDMKKR